MSEITTGSVAISFMSGPLVIGAAILGAAYLASRMCTRYSEKMLSEIQNADQRLQWLDKHVVSSPRRMAEHARMLQQAVTSNSTFQEMTAGLSTAQKEILSGVIATECSPLGAHLPETLETVPARNGVFETALQAATKQLAMKHYSYVNSVVRLAAADAGFDEDQIILKQTETRLDMAFVDKQGRRLTAYSKVNKELNPSLALDLEGFSCNDSECSDKMDVIIRYLHEHGVPFKCKRIKHNQPSGMLRELLERKTARTEVNLPDYLQGTLDPARNKVKQ